MEIEVYFTGFGKFNGVENNPTQEIVSKLPAYLQAHPLEASFRCPDERGWVPDKQLIIAENQSLKHCMHTTLPLEKLEQQLQQRGFAVERSMDPGRFICNFMYYHSLRFSETNHTESLFVHVPSFDIISEEEQLQFVRELLSLLAQEYTAASQRDQ